MAASVRRKRSLERDERSSCCGKPPAVDAAPQRHSREGMPVDRGWAWVVMAAACGIYGLHGAAFKTQGIVYIEMLEHYSSDQQVTLWVFSVAGTVMLSSSPLVSHIILKTSHRTVLLLGTASIAGGTILSGYAPIMEVAFFTWGVLYGFGHCCLLMASLTCTAQYFKKYHGLAVGITAAGSGAMSFVLPVILRHLFDSLPFDGAMLIYGGLACQLFALSMLVRPASCYVSSGEHSMGRSPLATEPTSLSAPRSEPPLVAASFLQSCNSGRADESCSLTRPGDCAEIQVASHREEVRRASPISIDLLAAGDLPSDVIAQEQRISSGHSRVCQPEEPGGKASVAAAAVSSDGRSIVHLLRDAPVVLVSITMMFFANGINIVYTVIPPYGESAGISKETVSTLLAVGGGIEVVCRGLHGWFSDKKVVSSLLQLAFCSGVTGLASVLCPVLGGAAGIGLLSCTCGFAGTSAFSLVPIILHDLIEAESVTTALGVQMFLRGFSFILSTYVAGYVVEKTGSWDGVFHYIGINAFISTFITVGVFFWNRRRGRLSAHSSVVSKHS